MRLTNNTLLRGYNRSLNRLKIAKNDCENKITSQRKFSRASEAPLSAAKALNVRKSQYYSAQHKENLKTASSFYTEAETSLLQVSEKMAEVRETLVAAVNTTKDNMDYAIYSQQLETRAQELCAIFNTDSAGRTIFGGESNDAMPFEIINDSNGHASTVLYHGVPVNSLREYTDFPYSEKVYVDIGLGMKTDQKAHTQEPMSVLDISFNGAEITGCGAERSVADVDLSQIKAGRTYVFDIYCDGIKKTIEFTGDADMSTNVDNINKAMNAAYKKEMVNGMNHPVMDAQGIVYSVDKDGNPVEGGLVSIVNNKSSDKRRVEDLVVDNDSGYTDKFRLNFSAMKENTLYKVDVKVGDETKSIEFVSGNDDGTEYAEDITIRNFQEAVNAAFGEGVVTVSTHDPVKGIASAEGKRVELVPYVSQEDADKLNGVYEGVYAHVDVTEAAGTDKLNLSVMKFSSDTDETRDFNFSVGGTAIKITIKRDSSNKDIRDAVEKALDDKGFSIDDNGIVTNAAGKAQTITSTSANLVGKMKNYKIVPSSIKEGQKYGLKVVEGNTVKNFEFVAGADGDLSQIKDELKKAFGGDVTIDDNGVLFSSNNLPVLVTNNMEFVSDRAVVERERVYSNNYIQLTLDAARALRTGDIEYANACIDKIVSSNERLLVEIADLGCNEDFIDFNIERITTREMNLAERQNDLEAADPEYMITLMKQYEAYYNACLQMSSSVIPNSIFNYMR